MKRLFLTLIFAIPFLSMAQKADSDSLRLLFIGNSYTYYNDLPKMVYKIANSQNKKLSVKSVTKGGERLSGHLKNKELHKILTTQKWDYVVLQEHSSAPAKPTEVVSAETYRAATSLDSLIHLGSPKAKTIFYMTWGHKYGCQHKIENYPLVYTYEGMQERLKLSYLEMAYKNNARCAPVGMAWEEVRQNRPDYQLYDADCTHPSKLGSYLAANVIYTTIFCQPYQTDYTAGLENEISEYIQQVAQRNVLENKAILNIK